VSGETIAAGEPVERFKTDQERFWAGEFGDRYTERNRGQGWVASNTALFSEILSHTRGVGSVIEFGANLGLNLIALRRLLPEAELSAVEINRKAVEELKRLEGIKVYHQSLLEFEPEYPRDLALSKGVLIHLHPESLPEAYERIYRSCRRYVCLAEYYNPTPVEVTYRGLSERLFKRDFAGEMLAKYGELRLAAYGFAYHGDPNFPQDDITWFLLEKTGTTK
jgi:spore coat polysaccharide biosynthesis protein SpsF